MKTSNIITIAFIVFLLSGMLILFVDAKQHKREMDESTNFKAYPLPAFSVIIAEEGADLHINQSDTTSVSVEYIKNQKSPSKMYKVVNDTLHIYGGLRTFVKCKDISSIIVQNAFWVGAYKFSPDSLTIKANDGRFYFDNSGIVKKRCFNIGVIASDSAYVEIRNSNVNNLSVKSTNAEVHLSCNVKTLTAKLEHKAKLGGANPLNIHAERDTTSELNWW